MKIFKNYSILIGDVLFLALVLLVFIMLFIIRNIISSTLTLFVGILMFIVCISIGLYKSLNDKFKIEVNSDNLLKLYSVLKQQSIKIEEIKSVKVRKTIGYYRPTLTFIIKLDNSKVKFTVIDNPYDFFDYIKTTPAFRKLISEGLEISKDDLRIDNPTIFNFRKVNK